jgi:outer membrane protein insertion porin family
VIGELKSPIRPRALGIVLLGVIASLAAPPASAQEIANVRAPNPTTICGQPIPAPAALPPAGSGPVVYLIAPCWEAQGNQTLIEPQTYLYYIQLKGSRPSEGVWTPYDETTDKTILEDFRRLWATNFLDNLWIEKQEYRFSNGVIGELITYNMEERQRVKIVDYTGSKNIESSKIDERLKDSNVQVKLDSFIDAGVVKKVAGIVTDMMREKGFQAATVTPEIKEVPGGPKLVHLTFKIDEGPKIKIRSIEFVGNHAVSSAKLRKQMKENKQRAWYVRMFAGRATYQEAKYDEDAEKVSGYYRDNGYIGARVGQPQLKYVEEASKKKTRLVDLRIPIEEGKRYKVGEFNFDGNTVVKSTDLRTFFKLKTGEYYSEKVVRKGLEKAREAYGAGGYMEFTGYPDLKPRDAANAAEPETPAALIAEPEKPAGPPVVDVVMRLQEGKQFFVNRITFVGNTTTRDNVIRREVRLLEDGLFNTEALKYSVKRLNQLGYFKALDGTKDVDVQKTAGADNKVDLKLKLEEQNRNQLSFGAGVSEYEGFFGQLSFQTSNFLGRGETLSMSVQAGSRASQYQVGFTEPFLFDRNITAGLNVFHTEIRYVGQFTQQSNGAVVTFGWPLGGFTRMFTNYSYERVHVSEINDVYTDPVVLARNPFLRDSLLLGQNGERVISKIVPSFVHNTVDNPITPTTGKRYTLSIDLAGIGGNTNFYKPSIEGVWYWKQNARMSLGWRAQYEYIHTFTGNQELPIFQKLFQGGEYSVRGFDIRSIGPRDPITGLVLGGDKSALFNIEELIGIAGPVRLVVFYDAGEVEPGPQVVNPAPFTPEGQFVGQVLKAGRNFNWQDFKTSTGLEIRFFMPVLNVPFRLIFAYNPQRSGVLDNNLQPQKAFQFRFAVGSTF